MNEEQRLIRAIAIAEACGHPWIADHGRRKLKKLRASPQRIPVRNIPIKSMESIGKDDND